MKVDSIILARGGSKGIPGKNIIDFCGKPLLAWSIEQCCTAKSVTGIWVSSNSDEILDVAREYGANTIRRPDEISGDLATSESGWLHAIKMIELESGQIDLVLAPQVTSPLREPEDIERGIRTFIEGGYDSMFSCSVAEDLFFWERDSEGVLRSVNY
ncbi:MAG: acylneuraminate cytidylyltransferase family protein, partial [Candidatus Scalindua sp.]|nr:acylneuraminate cytidylyltransferase family protein [Candidatus Scalindua sp.]